MFYQEDKTEHLAAFVSLNGAARYGHEPSADYLRLTRAQGQQGEITEIITTAIGEQVRLFGVAEAALWTVAAI